jgi:hypothetical protein
MERLEVMDKKQAIYYDHYDAFRKASPNSDLKKWRTSILEWYFEVVDHVERDRSVAVLAINFMDRYMAAKFGTGADGTTKAISKHIYHLAAMTSLMLASKLYLTTRFDHRCHISITYMLYVSGGNYTKKHVEDMESDMLFALNWLVHPPIHSEFIEQLFHLMPRWTNDRETRFQAFEHARYAAELAVLSSVGKPAKMAFACILSASKHLPRTVRAAFVRNVGVALDLTPDDVLRERDFVMELTRSVLNADSSSL